MTNEEIAKKVAAAIADKLGTRVDDVTPEKELVNDLGADSLDVVEIVMAVEDEFNIEILDSEMDVLKTVQDWTNLVSTKLADR